MAIKGLSIPVFGKYNYDSAAETVKYTDGFINPHAVEYSATLETADNNPLYADNRIVENDRGTFAGGTLSLGVDDFTQETSKFLLGVKEITRTYGTDKTVTSLIYDDDQTAPVLGVGIIEEHQNDDKTQYKAVIFKKSVFNIPEDAATTRGSSIDWQTRTIEGTLMRSDEVSENGYHPWKEEAWFETEGGALEFLKAMLGVGTE